MILAGAAALATTSLALAGCAGDDGAPGVSASGSGEVLSDSSDVKVLGPEQVVFDWSKGACAPLDYPDLPVRAFRDAGGRVQLIASHFVTRRMVGPDLDHLRRDCRPVMSSHRNPRPDRFDDREWIAAPYTRDGRTVYALVHNEYQGHLHPGRCPSGEYERCWYNALTLAVSENGGRSFAHARAPRHLVASVPYRYQPDRGPVGLLQPSNIVYRAADRHYYALFLAFGYRGQTRGSCLMRTRRLSDPGSWRAWNGRAFSVRLANPYKAAAGAPRQHVCQPVARDQISEMTQSLTYNTYFKRFLLVGSAGAYDREKRRDVWGVYYSLSDDLVHWSPRKRILEAELPWTHRCGDRNPILYPAVLDSKSRSLNFETTGRRVYLYFTRFNYTSCRQPSDRDLIRVPIEFSK